MPRVAHTEMKASLFAMHELEIAATPLLLLEERLVLADREEPHIACGDTYYVL